MPADKTNPIGEPLAVRPKTAFALLDIGKTLGFEMLADGRQERVRYGPRAVGVTMASIKRVAAGRATSALPREPAPPAPQPEPRPRLVRRPKGTAS